jgi:hypothetical protein
MNYLQGDLIVSGDGIKTCDLYLAAFLITASCKLKDTVRDLRKVYFIFENTDIIDQLKMDYLTRKASVDALSYADNIKSLKSLCANIMGSTIPRG